MMDLSWDDNDDDAIELATHQCLEDFDDELMEYYEAIVVEGVVPANVWGGEAPVLAASKARNTSSSALKLGIPLARPCAAGLHHRAYHRPGRGGAPGTALPGASARAAGVRAKTPVCKSGQSRPWGLLVQGFGLQIGWAAMSGGHVTSWGLQGSG